MSRHASLRTRTRPLPLAAATVVVVAAIAGCGTPRDAAVTAHDGRHPHRPASVGVAGGEVDDDTSVFADVPGVTRLDPALLAALRAAATAAGGVGIEVDVNSGWRSRTYQERLFREAVARYGSEQEAARWVARPGTSVHESGDAVDVGPPSAATWLDDHGSRFGLCRVYGNEPWHFELRPQAVALGCPATYGDPTDDPRLRS